LDACTALALNLVGLGDVNRAVAAIETLRRLAPDHLSARLVDGYQLERPEDDRRARVFLRIAAGLEDPREADALR